MVFNFEKHLNKVNEFISTLAYNLGIENKQAVYRILRSVLHTLRDIISLQESLQLMAQLPMFLKGMYAEEWKVKPRKVKIRNIADFVEKVEEKHGAEFLDDFGGHEQIERACRIVFRTLSDFVSRGEIEDIRAVLPADVKALFDNEMILI